MSAAAVSALGWHPAVVFVARHSGKALDATNGTHCEQRTKTNVQSQIFHLVDCHDGSYNIVHRATGKYLDVSGASDKDGAEILLWAPHGGANQKWKLTPHSDGYVTLTATHSGKSIDVEGNSQNDGARTFQWTTHGNHNQQWKVERVDSDQIKIRFKHNSKVLEAASGDNGARLYQRDDNGNANQHFILRTNGQYYRFTHATSGRAVDVEGAATANGTGMLLWDVHGGANQEFLLQAKPNGWYVLLPHHALEKNERKAFDGPFDPNQPSLIWDAKEDGNNDNQQVRFEFV